MRADAATCATAATGLSWVAGLARRLLALPGGRLERKDLTMLSDACVTTMLPVKDMARARG